MSYVDAGYTIVLVALVLYALALIARRRRLETAARRGGASEHGTEGAVMANAPDAGGVREVRGVRDTGGVGEVSASDQRR